ncbi:unnamed protein product, partial [Closterium sp. NIES-53]
ALEGERVEERGLLLDFHATLLPFSLPLPPPPPTATSAARRERKRGGQLVAVCWSPPSPPHPPLPTPAGTAGREMGHSSAVEATRASAARARGLLLRVRVPLCARLLCDGARDGLRTAGAFATVDGAFATVDDAFATVDGAFATGRTRDEGMTEVWWAHYGKVRMNGSLLIPCQSKLIS